jgi:DNA-directed RNA polymerase specialized sigma24 family protein
LNDLDHEDWLRFEQLVLPMSTMLSTSRAGCCAAAQMPKMSLRKLAAITSIPVGTVVSSLSRAHCQLYSALANSPLQEAVREV